jgi:hypothetical protein
MPSWSHHVEEKLRAAFPLRTIAGVITPHECPECDAIRKRLAQKTWADVPDGFAEEFVSRHRATALSRLLCAATVGSIPGGSDAKLSDIARLI